ncbi:rRNA maturation RNase YbeY [Ulvibacter litoralis]|uniref:Endoribonuclease YbeY n=1 Tax=Ulvibacter litoralis TaxID=227084 RepID=A0A1G7D9Z7_9FLAO|nr:rRNA maturation RNase YbeY [Ulvibacter litoralis]GHC44353.1 endoribonuclease YbeY [Ulvibacter litoralis]SDE48329.1 rRNA maturation RNase YbeY [Ulvibacter litoralis]
MIDFAYQNDFKLENEAAVASWISSIISSEDFAEGDISYVFCDDDYLHNLNKEFLDHDTLTDIISFDYSMGTQIHGEIYISVDRVAENAEAFETGFLNELHRVIIHGILHYCGYKDKTESEAALMRSKEEAALLKRNFV